METFKLYRTTKTDDVYFDHASCMYCQEWEDRVNQLAGRTITKPGPEVGGFFGSFINSFSVLKIHEKLFFEKVMPHMTKGEDGYYYWLEEVATANEI